MVVVCADATRHWAPKSFHFSAQISVWIAVRIRLFDVERPKALRHLTPKAGLSEAEEALGEGKGTAYTGPRWGVMLCL